MPVKACSYRCGKADCHYIAVALRRESPRAAESPNIHHIKRSITQQLRSVATGVLQRHRPGSDGKRCADADLPQLLVPGELRSSLPSRLAAMSA